MKKLHAALAVILWLVPLAQAASPEVSRPALSFEVESLAKFLAEVALVARAVEAPDNPDALIAGLASMMDLPDLSSLATNQPFSVHVFLPSPRPQSRPEELFQTPPQFVFVLPVIQQGKPYLAAIAEILGEARRLNNMHQFGAAGAGVGGSHNVLALGDRVVVGKDERSVRLVANMLMQAPGPSAVPSVAGTLRLKLNMPVVVRALEAYLPTLIQMQGGRPSARPKSDDDLPEVPEVDPGKMLASQQKLLLEVLRQVSTVSLGLTARAKALDLLVKTDYIPGTPLAGVIGGLRPPSDRIMTSIPTNALFAVAGSGMAMLDSLNAPLVEFTRELYASMGPQGEALGAFMSKLLTDSKGLYAGDYAAGVFQEPGSRKFALVQIQEVKDPARARRIQEEALKQLQTGSHWAALGVKVTMKPTRTHRGAHIIAADYASTNAPGKAGRPPMKPNPFGSAFSSEVAFKDNYMITVTGESKAMDTLLDAWEGAGARLDKAPVFASVFPTMKQQPVALWYISPLSLIRRWLASVLPAEAAQALSSIPESPSGMAGFSMVEGTMETSYTRLRMDEIAAIRKAAESIGAAFMQMAMGAMAAELGDGPGTPGSAANPRLLCKNNLRLIDHAKEVVAIKKNLEDGAAVTETDILPYISGKMPVCPEGGKYQIGPIGQNPTCSHAGHSL